MGKKAAGGGDREDPDKKLRIAIVNSDRCKPKKCKQECKTHCPVVRTGKLCVEVSKDSKISWISETLCIGCGICVKKCPFEAIQIINLPKDLSSHTTHRYGPNTFKLHRLPTPRPGQVLGLVGTNGIGKSTALMVLAGKLKPNLGRFDNPPDWQEIIQHFRGSELQSYIKGMLEDRLKAMIKPQYVDKLPKTIAGTVQAILDMKDEKKMKEHFCKELELNHLQEREIKDLSGGELQRFSIAVLCVQDAQVYMFDEPSSYLDVKQRIAAAQVVRSLQTVDNYIVVVEHDLAVLDYLSDFICCLWGSAGAYGVVTMPFSVREGINIFLDGFIPTENLRFREVSLSFKVSEDLDPSKLDRLHNTEYPMMTKKMGTFQLDIQAGNFASSEILVLLGQNGTGKTTFIRMLAGLLKPDDMKEGDELPELNVSYKPQTISAKFDGTVKDLFLGKIRDAFLHPQFQTDVTKPMLIDQIADHNVQTLSGGELQRVALVLSLGKPIVVVIYAAVRLLFGSCENFGYQLRSETRELLGYPPLPLREDAEGREVAITGMSQGLLQAFFEILPLSRDIPASTAEPANGGPACPVCILNWPNAALDCGHRVCAACLQEIRGRSNCCPVCRDPIRRAVRLHN